MGRRLNGCRLYGLTSLIWMDGRTDKISVYYTVSSGSFRNFWVISGNSVNSGNSVIPLKFPLNLRVIPGLRKYNIFLLDFRHSEFRVRQNSINFPVTHCLNSNHLPTAISIQFLYHKGTSEQ